MGLFHSAFLFLALVSPSWGTPLYDFERSTSTLDRTPPQNYLRRAGEAFVRKDYDTTEENVARARKIALATMEAGDALLYVGYESWAEGNRLWEIDPADTHGVSKYFYREALAHFEAFSKLRPDDNEGDLAAGELTFMIRDLKGAEEYFKRALAVNFQEPGVRVRLAQIARHRQDRHCAYVFLNDEIKMNPRSDSAYAERGNLYMSEWKIGDAEIDYRKALEINPDNIEAHFGLGVAYHLSGNYESAIQQLWTVKALDLHFKDADWQLGMIYQKMNRLDKSIAAFKSYKSIAALYRETESVRMAEEQIRKLASLK